MAKLSQEELEIHREAHMLRSSHHVAVLNRAYYQQRAQESRERQGRLYRSSTERFAAGNKRLSEEDHAYALLNGENAKLDDQSADTHEKFRIEAIAKALTHLIEHREVYERVAIDEANAAGVDITFGGVHYTAQASEQPKEPQMQ